MNEAIQNEDGARSDRLSRSIAWKICQGNGRGAAPRLPKVAPASISFSANVINLSACKYPISGRSFILAKGKALYLKEAVLAALSGGDH